MFGDGPRTDLPLSLLFCVTSGAGALSTTLPWKMVLLLQKCAHVGNMAWNLHRHERVWAFPTQYENQAIPVLSLIHI